MAQSLEERVFQQHHVSLIHAIESPDVLVWKLCTKGILSHDVRDQVRGPARSQGRELQTGILLSAMGAKIKAEPRVFHSFVRFLRDSADHHLKALGDQLKISYGKTAT